MDERSISIGSTPTHATVSFPKPGFISLAFTSNNQEAKVTLALADMRLVHEMIGRGLRVATAPTVPTTRQ